MPNLGQSMGSADAARLAPLVGIPDKESAPVSPIDDEEKEPFLPVGKLRTMFIDYLTTKVDEIEEQQRSRRMYHGAQWTAEQIRILKQRHQPPITWNRINRKINGIIGVVERQRSDPKALPRHIRSEQGANLATQVIRYVLESNDFKGIDPWCLLQASIDGIAGVQKVLTKDDQGETDIALPWVIGDEYFYDPKSYRADFSDARYEGVSKWLALGEAIELFPDKEEQLRGLISGDADLTTNPDREYKWVIASTQHVRLVEHWYKHLGKWKWAFYVSNTLLDQGVSPFFDERGKSARSYHMFAVAVDHDGDRYGFVRNLEGPQNSLNQSKSKALHVANSRRLIADKGAVDNVEKARTEWARPDGFVEKNPGLNITPDDRPQDLSAFTGMAESASQEIDQFASINVAILAGASMANISGRAIELLRQPGMAELGPFILNVRQWKLQLYRGIWNTVQRYWTSPKWIRMVDDDAQKPTFVQLNTLSLDQFGRPVIVNALGALDVDIILEEGPDVASLAQDVYEMMKGYPPGTFPPQVLIEMSPMPRTDKNRILQMLKPQPNPLQLKALQTQMEAAALKNTKTAADARKSDAQAQKAMAEAGSVGDQLSLDSAALQHQMWVEALQIAQPPQPPQPGAGGPPGAPGQMGAPQPQGPMPGLHPAMPARPAF
jgi:hypothetical protein